MAVKRVFFQGLKPHRLLGSVRKRGVGGTATHLLRRAGTITGKALVGPAVMRINPMGYICNHACPMCWLQHLDADYLKEQKKIDVADNLKAEDYERLFDSMPPGLLEVNVVGGGEPLVHKQAVAILRAVKTRGLKGSLITNGSLLREPVAEALVEMGWDDVRVSVHGGSPDVYSAIQGVDHFDTVRRNLIHFDKRRREAGRQARCGLTVFHVLQHENIPKIHELFRFAEEVGADQMVMEKIIPYDSGKWLSKEELESASRQIAECAERFKVPFNREAILGQLRSEQKSMESDGRPWIPAKRCSVGFDEVFITAMGDVMPCCFSDDTMGNVREQPFHAIWQNENYRKFRSELINGRFRKYCISNRCHLPNVLHN